MVIDWSLNGKVPALVEATASLNQILVTDCRAQGNRYNINISVLINIQWTLGMSKYAIADLVLVLSTLGIFPLKYKIWYILHVETFLRHACSIN